MKIDGRNDVIDEVNEEWHTCFALQVKQPPLERNGWSALPVVPWTPGVGATTCGENDSIMIAYALGYSAVLSAAWGE